MALALGLTGGIGSGKSTVAQVLVGLGAHLVDTDAIAHAITRPGGAAMPALQAAFGPQALTHEGALNREHMRQIAFTDAEAKRRLEKILHPLIGEEALRQAAQAAGRPVVFDVPLLDEGSSWRARVHKVLVIDCPEETQIARVVQRPGWSEASARRVVALQASRNARRALADAIIFNSGLGLQALQTEVQAIWQAWVGPHASR